MVAEQPEKIDTPDRNPGAQDNARQRVEREPILIVCAGSARIDAFANLFRSLGFRVERRSELPSIAEREQFGAIVHLAHTYNDLCRLLENSSTLVPAREWVFMDGEDGDFHCTIQLTPEASFGLKSFVRSLWSIFNVT